MHGILLPNSAYTAYVWTSYSLSVIGIVVSWKTEVECYIPLHALLLVHKDQTNNAASILSSAFSVT